MAFDPAKLSVSELRRLVGDETSPSPALLRKLRRDPRQGVRSLYRTLERRREAELARRQQLDRLLHFERVLWRAGARRVAGVDEAGVGPLAGPVVAAAVVFRSDVAIVGIDDSKRLDAPSRARLAAEIRRQAAVGIGIAEVAEIDEINVYQAALLAMRRAVEALSHPPDHLLVDARQVPGVSMPQNQFDKGDGINYSIAAASIVAKVHRDALMEALDAQHPEYGFARHKGYSTPEHQEAIREHGPSPAHRASFTFLRELCGEYSDRFYALQRSLDDCASDDALRDVEREIEGDRGGLAEVELKKLRLVVNRRWKTLAARG